MNTEQKKHNMSFFVCFCTMWPHLFETHTLFSTASNFAFLPRAISRADQSIALKLDGLQSVACCLAQLTASLDLIVFADWVHDFMTSSTAGNQAVFTGRLATLQTREHLFSIN